MGIWIRTQNRHGLVKVDNVALDDSALLRGRLISHLDKVYVELGEYETRKRALEVLDMIQTRIIKGATFDYINNSKRTTKEFVFQMPEE